MKKINIKSLITSILIPILTGILSSLLTIDSMGNFMSVKKTPLSPPEIIFPIVWTALYILMGVSSYLIKESGKSKILIKRVLNIYYISLFINFFWSIIFFNLRAYTFAFIWLLILFITVVLTYIKYYDIRKSAAYLQIPYITWIIFAGYLNLMISILN